MSATTRRMPSHAGLRPGFQPKSSGRLPRKKVQSKAISWRAVCITRLHSRPPRPEGNSRRCMEMCGNGHKARTLPIQALSLPPVRSGNTMGSSCAISMSCAVVHAPPPFRTFGPLTATSFRPTRSGSLWVFDSQGMYKMQPHMHSPQRLYDFEPLQKTFRDEVLQGLQDARKELPSKYFYDDVGSQLFEHICELDEYYLTRTELGIMQEQMHEIVTLLGPNCLLIEYGSGSSTKTRILPLPYSISKQFGPSSVTISCICSCMMPSTVRVR